MIYGIISDIHANLEALNTSLEFLKFVDRIICLGDIVGYGPYPNECIEKLASLDNLICLKGNHDHRTYLHYHNPNLEEDPAEYGHYNPAELFGWKRKDLKKENMGFLESLPYRLFVDGMLLSHGSPIIPTDFYYVDDRQERKYEVGLIDGVLELEEPINSLAEVAGFLDYQKINLTFYGHSHKAVNNLVYKFTNDTGFVTFPGKFVNLNSNLTVEGVSKPISMALINVGSIGQPRDYDPRSCIIIYDSDKQTIVKKRLEYDVEKTQKAMKEQGIDTSFIRRLEKGL